jgi:hypothetical protein
VYFESIGIPTAAVLSSEFQPAAAAQSLRLGMPALLPVIVPHPIQDRTDEELAVLAEGAFDEIIRRLTG